MSISLIVAVANNGVIGKDNQLIWRLPADLRYFKTKTTGHHIIMGRKNYESIGRPLPNRISVVVTKDKTYSAEGCIIVHSIDEALAVAKTDNEIFIIGGGMIYDQTIDMAEILYVTRIYHSFGGDVFFPAINPDQWQISNRKDCAPDSKNPYFYSFLTYHRKSV